MCLVNMIWKVWKLFYKKIIDTWLKQFIPASETPPKILPILPNELILCRLKVSGSMIRNGWIVLDGAGIPSTEDVWLFGGVTVPVWQSSSSFCSFCLISLNLLLLPIWRSKTWGLIKILESFSLPSKLFMSFFSSVIPDMFGSELNFFMIVSLEDFPTGLNQKINSQKSKIHWLKNTSQNMRFVFVYCQINNSLSKKIFQDTINVYEGITRGKNTHCVIFPII